MVKNNKKPDAILLGKRINIMNAKMILYILVLPDN
jgi:hypothetical protein